MLLERWSPEVAVGGFTRWFLRSRVNRFRAEKVNADNHKEREFYDQGEQEKGHKLGEDLRL